MCNGVNMPCAARISANTMCLDLAAAMPLTHGTYIPMDYVIKHCGGRKLWDLTGAKPQLAIDPIQTQIRKSQQHAFTSRTCRSALHYLCILIEFLV
jgi:hypothetical protein